MPAYIVALVNVKDPEAYKAYTARTPDEIKKGGGRFLVRGNPDEMLEGEWPGIRVVVIEYPSMEAARDFYNSPSYQEIIPLRMGASDGCLALFDAAPPM